MKRIGYTPIRALSIGGAYGDLRNDWEALTDNEKLFFDTFPALIVIAAIALIVWTFFLGGSAVHVSSRTEHLVYTPLLSDPPIWLLKDAVFENSDLYDIDLFEETESADASSNSSLTSSATYGELHKAEIDGRETVFVNGFLQLNCGDRVTVSRIGTGLIKVDVNAVTAVNISDEVGDPVRFINPLKTSFSFYPHSRPGRFKGLPIRFAADSLESTSYVWPMEGQIFPSREVGVDTVTTQGLMLSGRVELLNRRMWSKSSYTVDSHELELGDHLILETAKKTEEKLNDILHKRKTNSDETPEGCANLRPDQPMLSSRFSSPDGTDKGFLHIDEEKGMAVSLASNAESVEIIRFRTTATSLKSSLIKRLQNDRLFGLGWSAILFAFIAYRTLARAYVMSRGRENSLVESDTSPNNRTSETPQSASPDTAASSEDRSANNTGQTSDNFSPPSPDQPSGATGSPDSSDD